MAIVGSFVFLLTLFITAYALYATIVPALQKFEALVAGPEPLGKPRLIYFGIDRRTARAIEDNRKVVLLERRMVAPKISRAAETHVLRAA